MISNKLKTELRMNAFFPEKAKGSAHPHTRTLSNHPMSTAKCQTLLVLNGVTTRVTSLLCSLDSRSAS